MIDLTNYTLLDIYGIERRTLEGSYTEDDLIRLFVEEWIPLYGCSMCSRANYCKFYNPTPEDLQFMDDEQCGAVVNAIKNFVWGTFSELEHFSNEQIQSYLDGAYFLTQFLYSAELNIGYTMDSTYVRGLKDWAPAFFGNIAHLRAYLDNLSSTLSSIPSFQSYKGVVLVEGESEKAFINQLKLSHLSSFLRLPVDSYQGKGNRGKSHLHLLLKRYAAQGYKVFLQGDADGSTVDDIFSDLISKGMISIENVFVFKYDFESAIPTALLYHTLIDMGYLRDISRDEFAQNINNNDLNIHKRLIEAYQINLEKEKVNLAKTVANILNRTYWWKSEKFLKTELGQFLQFLRKIS